MTKEEFAEKFCDEYCRFPYICTKDELDEKCEHCVIELLQGGDQ